jgi:hypothetical protein
MGILNAGVITRLVRNCALGRVIQYSREGTAGAEKPRRTGCPAFAGHDSGGCPLNPPPLPGDQCEAPVQPRPGLGTFQMESIRPDTTDPIPLRPAPNQFGTIMLRFVGLLAVAIAVLAFVYSR